MIFMENITFFHMSEKDFSNKIYKELYSTKIDLYDLRETYIMCHLDVLEEISKRLPIHQNDRLYYLGNGNYHYLTLVLLKRLTEPYTLITFDHHNDAGDFPFPEMTSCGSWIQTAIEMFPLMERVIVIGADQENGKKTGKNVSNKIFFVKNEENSFQSLQKTASLIQTKNIYISIDRDYLSEEVVQTNWDQGKNKLPDLLQAIKVLANHHILVGADVCGDIVWDYRTLSQFTMQSTLQQSIKVNQKIFEALSNLL